MKPILNVPFWSAVCSACLIAAAASQNTAWASGCNYATIKGSYGFVFSGFDEGNGISPFTGVGPVTFDGKGNFSGSLLLGWPDTGSNGRVSGTYTVNADCTDSLNGTNGTNNFAFVIVSGGAEILMVNLTPGQSFTLDAKRIEAP